ncbi:esterase/lipase family protein [Bacillus paralicheniformis]|uniref:esterase/lipase family protein n=1 Tax=Bacillus paralicheniformis TaxID=1648923 RepID=UPI0035F5B4ED
MKKLVLLMLVLLLVYPNVSKAGGFKGGGGDPGHWFAGDPVEHPDPAKPPIVFVHGLNGSSSAWFDENDMAEQAWKNGYNAAFIDLHPDKDMQDNGAMLAAKLREIYQHFGRKVILISYSKGGIDSQSALIHHNAYHYVERVITLGTPHHGSQLADLAYSSWAGWLAAILGQRNDAVYSLQTGFMKSFRDQTDNHSNRSKTKYFTLAGNKIGGFGSVLFFGGVYLNMFGENDGAVTEKNARLPYATNLNTGKWDHFSIIKGNLTFPVFMPLLTVQAYANETANIKENLSYPFIRGGENHGLREEEFAVEKGVKEITVHWLSNHSSGNIKLTDPHGKPLKDFSIAKTADVFEGGFVHSAAIKNPAAGTWKIASSVKQKEAFLFIVTYDSPLNEQIKTAVTRESSNLSNVKASVRSIRYENGKQAEKKSLKPASINALQNSLSFKKAGMYSVTIDLSGKTADNSPFNRTIIRSIYVNDKGEKFENSPLSD